VVFQLCGQRSVAEIAAELAAKLRLGVETKPPEEQIAAGKAWLAERRALLVLDDIWENDVIALAPGPPVSLLCTSRRHSLLNIALTISRNLFRAETIERFSIVLPFLQNGGPTQAGLGAFQDEKLKQFAIIMDRNAPFLVVIGNVWFNGSPGTARHLGVQLSSGLARRHRRQM